MHDLMHEASNQLFPTLSFSLFNFGTQYTQNSEDHLGFYRHLVCNKFLLYYLHVERALRVELARHSGG